MPQLNQIVAIEKGVKSRTYSEVSDLHKRSQKSDPYQGFTKKFRKKDEDGEDYPPENKKVLLVAEDVLKSVAKAQTELFDVTATKDFANCDAKADVVVDGQTLIESAPITYLLFLEKQLVDMRTFIDKLPTLDPNEDWTADPNSNLCKTDKITTHKTKKVQRAIVLYDATEHHPAQTQLVTEDVIVGWWDTIKMSGAIPVPRKQQLLDRVDRLIKAVKFAREKANSKEVDHQYVGEGLFAYLLG